ncbi:MAG: hypothetical protein GWP47_16920 [Actinobacteria bacterium]|nr:hypothetical protein [Actinomycetota bacterium]
MTEPSKIIQRGRCERWFVRRGLPHLIDDYSATEDVLTRTAPFLTIVVFAELFLAFGDRWNGWSQLVAFIAGVGAMVAALALVNRFRGRRPLQLPNSGGLVELILYLGLPLVPTAIGSESSVGDNLVTILVSNLVILGLAYVVTSWGLFPMMRWSLGQVTRQIGDVATLAMKSLPILLVFSAFIFLNAEMWQVANDFTLAYFGLVSVLITGIGAAFVVFSVRRITVDLARFDDWADVRGRCVDTPVEGLVPGDDEKPPGAPALGHRAEFNVGMLLFVAQAIQIALVAVVITAFYIVFGLLTVREGTLVQWTTATELTRSADWALYWNVLGGELVFTRQLILVSAFIGMMSGLQFAVQVVTDEAYRAEFAEDMTAEVREALAVRTVYLTLEHEPDSM